MAQSDYMQNRLANSAKDKILQAKFAMYATGIILFVLGALPSCQNGRVDPISSILIVGLPGVALFVLAAIAKKRDEGYFHHSNGDKYFIRTTVFIIARCYLVWNSCNSLLSGIRRG